MLLNNYAKDIFNFVLGNYTDSVPLYCGSMKAFVQVNHLIVSKVREDIKTLSQKISGDVHDKLFEKVGNLAKMMLKFLLGRYKLGFLKQLAKVKEDVY